MTSGEWGVESAIEGVFSVDFVTPPSSFLVG
jgi:hypothetical protein